MKNARARGLELSGTVEFQFRRRYNLPPTDPRFLNATATEILTDYWAHRHSDEPKLRDEEFDPDFEAELAAAESEWETVADDKFEG